MIDTEDQTTEREVWFIYDGDCPICNVAARGFAIKKAVGTLKLLDARSNMDHQLLKEINARQLDLDESMVIKMDQQYYQGQDALQLMALLGTNVGWFNRLTYLLFRHVTLSKIGYPFLRLIRNSLIRMRNRDKIRNLNYANSDGTIFREILGPIWDELPRVMKAHYRNKAFCNDVTEMQGHLNVHTSWYSKLLSPAFAVLGALVPYKGTQVPVNVKARSNPTSNAYILEREFNYEGKGIRHFRSTLEPFGRNELIEFLRFGVGWRSSFDWNGERIVLEHIGYVWRVFRINIPLPISWIIGKGNAYEIPMSDTEFEMYMEIKHVLFGKIYGYDGRFEVKSN